MQTENNSRINISDFGWEHYKDTMERQGRTLLFSEQSGGKNDSLTHGASGPPLKSKPARISRQFNNYYEAVANSGIYLAEVRGSLRRRAERSAGTGGAPASKDTDRDLPPQYEEEALPAVGDWVVIDEAGADRAVITSVLPRLNRLSRKTAGRETVEQVIAANVDIFFIVTGLDDNFNVNRIERYLTLAYESGVEPVIILNKVDLCDPEDLAVKQDAVESIAGVSPVLVVSAEYKIGMDEISAMITKGKTAVLAGSSGVGKSSIINSLLGEDRQTVQEIRDSDGRGRHTTTRRELIVLAGGGLIIDTPGMREVQLWAGEESLTQSFSDIEELAEECRFRDCRHESEPGCAVKAALEDGRLDAARFENYRKMEKEIAYLQRRQNENAARIERMKWKKLGHFGKIHSKAKRGDL
jgi:ribosome biogenesis GTPase